MKTKEDILFECWHESNDTSPTNETILKAMDRFAKEYHAEQLRIAVVGVRSEQLKSKKCGMCGKGKEDDGHNCCEDCGGISF